MEVGQRRPYSSAQQVELYRYVRDRVHEVHTHTIENLVNGREYHVRISAHDGDDYSTEWAESAATPQGVTDATAPSLQAASIDGDTLTLVYSEALDWDSVPGAGAFSVRTVEPSALQTVSSVAIDGFQVTLNLSGEVGAEGTVRVDYVVPTGADAAPIRDLSGNDAPALGFQLVEREMSVRREVCARTPGVGLALLDHVGVRDCRQLTPEVLSEIRRIEPFRRNIASLKAGDFDGLTRLEWLDLSLNRLTTLPAGAFAGLDRLRNLYLGYNRLESVPAAALSGLGGLRVLFLNHNGLENLSAGSLGGVSGLRYLRLDNNELQSLPQGVFENLTAIERLKVDTNPGSGDFSPRANAGEDQWQVPVGSTVELDGSSSEGGPWGDNVVYRWRQVDGTRVALRNADTERASFEFPDAPADAVLEFRLTVSAAGGIASSDDVRIGGGSPNSLHARSEDSNPFHARFENMPGRHDAMATFTFDLRFSEDIDGLGYRTVRDDALDVTGGRVVNARRLTRGSNQGWQVSVEPTSSGDIAISLPARACGEVGAICADDDRPLSGPVESIVVGPASDQFARNGSSRRQWNGTGGRDADCLDIGDWGHRRSGQRQVQLSVVAERRARGCGNRGSNRRELCPGRRRSRPRDQSAGDLHRRRRERGDADERGDRGGDRSAHGALRERSRVP